MDVTPNLPAGRRVIECYGDGRFRVGGQVFEGSILVFPKSVQAWPVRAMTELTLESLRPVTEAPDPVDVLLLGGGPNMAPVPAGLRRDLRAAGVVIEPMDTGAACRTYNVLLAEGRAVASALIAMPGTHENAGPFGPASGYLAQRFAGQ